MTKTLTTEVLAQIKADAAARKAMPEFGESVEGNIQRLHVIGTTRSHFSTEAVEMLVKALEELLANREAQPSITDEAIDRIVVPLSLDGLDEEKHHCEWHLYHERERIRKELREHFTAPPAVPNGWESCSPEWIERNGPCSCGEAPRIAFGLIGNHYHPHLWHKPAIATVVNPELTGATAVPDISALTDLIFDRLIDCIAADDDSIADAETFVYNACRAAMLNHSGDADNMVKATPVMPKELVEEPGTWKTPDVVFGWNACRAAMLAQPVSHGYKLVPVEPTEDMLAAGRTLNDSQLNMTPRNRIEMVYRSMLAAAPEGGNEK